jgi:uncharacterized protein (DUF1778 family)
MVMRSKAAALFIRCSEEEAERVRKAARAERRSISGFILNAVFNRIQMRDKLAADARSKARPTLSNGLKLD